MVVAMTVYFCHGLESAPHGRKYHALVDAGFEVVAPDCQGLRLAERVELVRPLLADTSESYVVVGSSYGGITALCAVIQLAATGEQLPVGMVLCAPALLRSEAPASELELYAPCPIEIVHGVNDEVVPVEVSRRFAAANSNVLLHELDDGHRLAASLEHIVAATRRIHQQGLPARA